MCIASEVVCFALTPFISRVFHGKETINFKTFTEKLLIFSVMAGLAQGAILFFFRDLIITIFNENLVTTSSPYLKFLALVIPFRVVILALGAILSSSKYQKGRFLINLYTTIFYMISLTPLVHFYASTGAVYARMIAEVILFVSIFAYVLFKVKPNHINQPDAG
jgi:O-antigen/teichoic acid export membrane protein